MAVSLVALVFEVAEGGAMEVEGHSDCLRLLLLFHPLQNIQKAVDGMGVQAVPGCQRTNTEIGPVDHTVAV